MKRFFLFVCSVICIYSINAQITIPMEKVNGVYKIPCKVNGVKMNFIFDTGASNVCLSMQMAEFLFDNGYLTSDDFIGYGTSSVADGRIVNNMHITIRDIEIEGLHLTNVEGIVMESMSAPLLLGQSAIQKLGKISIDGNILTIWNSEKKTDLENLKSKAQNYEYKGLYHLSAPAWEEYYKVYWMTNEESDNDYAVIGDNYYLADDYHNTIKWYEKVGNNGDVNYNILYYRLGLCYLELGNYNVARRYADLSKKILSKPNDNNWQSWINVYYLNYLIDIRENNFSNAYGNIWNAAGMYAWGKYYDYIINNYVEDVCKALCSRGIQDTQFADYINRLASVCYLLGETNECFCKYIKYAVQLGSTKAKELYYKTEYYCSDEYKRIMNAYR